MNPLLIFFWIPYLSIILILARRPSYRVFALGITVVVGMINYELPFLFDQTVRMYHASILVLLFFLLNTDVRSYNPNLRLSDKNLRILIILFYIVLTVSYLFGELRLNNRLTYIYKIIDYPVLGIITLFVLRDLKDINTLLRFLILGALLMVIIGLGQFFTGDPTWGEMADISYNNDYFRGIEGRSNISGKEWRIASTATSPNSFGLVITMLLPFYFYFFDVSNRKYAFAFLLLFNIVALILSGARTAIVASIFVLTLLFIKKLNFFKLLGAAIIISLIVGFSLSSLRSTDSFRTISNQVTARFKTMESSEAIQESFESSRLYKWTKSWEGNADIDLLILGHGWIQRPGTAAPHNTYLSTLFLSGLWGLAIYLAIIIYTFRLAFRFRKDMLMYSITLSLVAYVFCGLSYENIVNTSVFIFWPLIGIAAKYTFLLKHSSNDS